MWKSLKNIPSFHLFWISGTFSCTTSFTLLVSVPSGVFITYKWSGCIKRAKVFLEIFFPAISSLLTTQCGVASKYPPVWIWVDSPNWKASMLGGDLDLCFLAEPILSKQATTQSFDWNLLSILVSIHGRAQSCQWPMIIMPPTPIIFRFTFILKWKIMKHSPNMTLSLRNDPRKMIFGIGWYNDGSIIINLFC